MGFLQDVGSYLGNAFGVNQSAGADKFRDIGTSALGTGATTAENNANYYNEAAKESYGKNAGDTMENAMGAAQRASQTAGRAAGGQVAGTARTAGLNKGQAAVEGGQAATRAYQNQIPAQIGNYLNAAQNLSSQGTANTGLGIQAGSSAANASYQQGDQAQKGAGGIFSTIGNAIAGIASDERLKKDVRKDTSLNEIRTKLKAIKFRYKGEPADATEHGGVMAQDLEKTPMKDVVTDTPVGKMIDTNKMTPHLLDLLLQLSDEVADLKKEKQDA